MTWKTPSTGAADLHPGLQEATCSCDTPSLTLSTSKLSKLWLPVLPFQKLLRRDKSFLRDFEDAFHRSSLTFTQAFKKQRACDTPSLTLSTILNSQNSDFHLFKIPGASPKTQVLPTWPGRRLPPVQPTFTQAFKKQHVLVILRR